MGEKKNTMQGRRVQTQINTLSMTFAAVVMLKTYWSASLQAEYNFSLALRSLAHLRKISYFLCLPPELE